MVRDMAVLVLHFFQTRSLCQAAMSIFFLRLVPKTLQDGLENFARPQVRQGHEDDDED